MKLFFRENWHMLGMFWVISRRLAFCGLVMDQGIQILLRRGGERLMFNCIICGRTERLFCCIGLALYFC